MSARLLLVPATLLLAVAAAGQVEQIVAYPQRDALSPFRNPTEAYAPPDEVFRLLRIMQHIADAPQAAKRYDERGRELVEDSRWQQAHVDLLRLGLDAGYLAQIMRLNRNPVDRATAFYGAFYCDNVGYVIELIEHIPGEPLRATRERALPRAIEFLRQNLNRRFGDLGKEQQAEIVKAMPQPGSPAAKARGITRAPTDSDPLHEIRLQPFFQLLDLEEPLDQAQGLWFLKEVFRQRLDLAQLWLEPALPRLRQLLGSADERVRAQAIELVQVVGPKDLVAPPDDDRARVDWANAAWKTLFPPIRNQNDAIVELHPSPERDALAAAAVAALETSAIGDPYAKRHDDGKWVRGFRVARVPDELKPLAIPAGAIITAVNGLGVSDAATLLRTVRRQLEIAKHPRSLILEYLRDGTTHAVEYRLR